MTAQELKDVLAMVDESCPDNHGMDPTCNNSCLECWVREIGIASAEQVSDLAAKVTLWAAQETADSAQEDAMP